MKFWILAAALCVASFVSASAAQAQDDAEEKEAVRLLVLDFKSDDTRVKKSELTTLAGLTASHLGRFSELDVMTASEMQSLVALESEKAVAGCADDSCLAEIANAIGARLVVLGQMGSLGQTRVLNLSLFDSDKGRVASRATVKAATLDVLAEKAEPVLDSMVNAFFGRKAEVVEEDKDPNKAADKPLQQKMETRKLIAGGVAGGGTAIGTGLGIVLAFAANSGSSRLINDPLTFPNGATNQLGVGVQTVSIAALGAYLGGTVGASFFMDVVQANIVGIVAALGYWVPAFGFSALSAIANSQEIQVAGAAGSTLFAGAVGIAAGAGMAYVFTTPDEDKNAGSSLFR